QQASLTKAENIRQQIEREKAEANAEGERLIRVPIQTRRKGFPIVKVRFNDRYTFDMAVDMASNQTIMSESMASLLQLQSTPGGYIYTTTGQRIPVSNGWVRSMQLHAATMVNVQVTIAPNLSEGILGRDFFAQYSVRILDHEIELYRR
ncbi:MAG: hypothetical protein F6K65_41945, partial [Moorea sp. SIO3C2]|nr:hypothetical protein [Moorena sp. SIO3C2]